MTKWPCSSSYSSYNCIQKASLVLGKTTFFGPESQLRLSVRWNYMPAKTKIYMGLLVKISKFHSSTNVSQTYQSNLLLYYNILCMVQRKHRADRTNFIKANPDIASQITNPSWFHWLCEIMRCLCIKKTWERVVWIIWEKNATLRILPFEHFFH